MPLKGKRIVDFEQDSGANPILSVGRHTHVFDLHRYSQLTRTSFFPALHVLKRR
jgi:hypothetical protein